MMKMVITPKFDALEIINSTIGKDCQFYQLRALQLGKKMHKYMQSYVNAHRRRSGGTGNLAKSINFEILATSPAQIRWGIGNINILQSKALYWYVVNYGKKVTGEAFIPGGGKYRPIQFNGSPADGNLRGRGTQKATAVRRITGGESLPSVIRPMNYIETTRAKLDGEIRQLLYKWKRRK